MDEERISKGVTLAEQVLNFRPKHDIISILKTAYDWHNKNDE